MSALGKFFIHQSDSTAGSLAVGLPLWLAYLPLKADLEEAAVCNEQLCE